MPVKMVENTYISNGKGLKVVHITACDSESESEAKINPLSIQLCK